jgi:phosphatidate cytidylyltransferase
MHRTRFIVALIFLPLFFVVVKYLSTVFFLVVVILAVVLGQYEFYRFYYPEGFPPVAYLGLFLGPLSAFAFYGNLIVPEGLSLAGLLLFLLLFQLFFFKDLQGSLGETAVIFLGIIYIGWLLGHLILLRDFKNGDGIILFLVLVTWIGDAGAYYIGKSFGQRKLYANISPGKTVEGAVGGLVSSLAVAFIGKVFFLPSLSWNDCLGLGLLLGVLGQLGDLTESLFKRSVGIKDSGGLIPAHGGVLDKIDSLLFTAPAFYYYLLLVKGYGRAVIVV